MKAALAALLALSAIGLRTPPQAAERSCPGRVESLTDAKTINALDTRDRARLLRALGNDVVEMGKQDVARTERNAEAYRQYFATWLEFAEVPGGAPGERLLVVRYDSNTVCGAYENCPTWIVSLTHSGARSLVPWRPGMGTSTTGAWGVAIQNEQGQRYPALMFLTHLDAYQTAVACYRKSGKYYLSVDCSPGCVHFLDKPRK